MIEYFRTIVSEDEEKWINKKINIEIYLSILFLTLLLISGLGSFTIIILGIFKLINFNIYSVLLYAFLFINVIFMAILDKTDILKKYGFNDKVFIYLYILIKQVDKIRKTPRFKRLKIFRSTFLLNKLAYLLWQIENKFKELFIFFDGRKEIELLIKLRKVFTRKLKIMIKNEEYDDIFNLINSLIDLYGSIVSKKFLSYSNNNEIACSIETDITKKDDIYNLINKLYESELDEVEKNGLSINNLIENTFIRISASFIVFILMVALVIIISKDPSKFSYLEGILSIVIIGFTFIFKLIFNSSKSNEKK